MTSPRNNERPRPGDIEQPSMMERLRASTNSVRQALALAGIGALAIGILVWVFFRDLAGPALIVMAVGLGFLVIDAGISWRTVSRSILGRRGRYGLNTTLVLIAFLAIAVIANYLLFWAVNRPSPAGWLRVDTTATKQFLIGDQAKTVLEQMNEPIRVTAFFTTNTPARAAAWRNTEDLLQEFERASTVQPFSYRLVDPELDPNVANEFGARRFPALVVEALDSRRTEVLTGDNPNDTTEVFNEQDLITGLLVVNQIRQKSVMFISGHSERTITDRDPLSSEYGLAAQALMRENYQVLAGTLQELGSLLNTEEAQSQLPAVVVLAGPSTDFIGVEDQILVQYARAGGSIMVTVEPFETPESVASFLSRWGIAIGTGEIVDLASFVAPNPLFLQIKKTNGQIPPHSINEDFDVLYVPGSTFIASTIDQATVPLTQNGRPYVSPSVIAQTTLESWAKASEEGGLEYEEGDQRGPLPVGLAVTAVSELSGAPILVDGQFVETNMVVFGDTDFASNNYLASANNADLFVNSINWLARDYELISIRPKTRTFRELVLTSSERDFVRWSGWLLMPSLIGLAGVWVWWRRR